MKDYKALTLMSDETLKVMYNELLSGKLNKDSAVRGLQAVLYFELGKTPTLEHVKYCVAMECMKRFGNI